MTTFNRKWAMLISVAVLAVVASIAITGPWSSGQDAQGAPAARGEAQLDLIVAVPQGQAISKTLETLGSLREFRVDSFFDIDYVSNLGSSGEDGVRVTNIGSSGQDGVRAAVDSFFDIDYRVFGDPDFDLLKVSARGTLADPSNPGAVLDEVSAVLKRPPHRGHVTVLK